MSTDDGQSIEKHRDECIQAAARVLARAALNLLYADPHQWSTRPCPTCRAITAMIDEPYGCDRFRIKK